jgi:muconolactone delta-isomerase
MQYLVTMTTHVPDGMPDQAVDKVRAREAACSRELAAAGHLVRLWRPPLRPGEWRSLGLFAAADDGQLEQALRRRAFGHDGTDARRVDHEYTIQSTGATSYGVPALDALPSGVADIQVVQHGVEVGGEGVVVIPGCRLTGLDDPAPVVGDDPVPGLQQDRDLLVPGPALSG